MFLRFLRPVAKPIHAQIPRRSPVFVLRQIEMGQWEIHCRLTASHSILLPLGGESPPWLREEQGTTPKIKQPAGRNFRHFHDRDVGQ